MDLKFINILTNFLPKGKFWEDQPYVKKIIAGVSNEYSIVYEKAKYFYTTFNIIKSQELATIHSQDYLITQGLYTKAELQRIIVKYLNKDYDLKFIIEDFADFIGTGIEFGSVASPFIVGRNTIGNSLGDPTYNNTRMMLYVKFLNVNDVINIRKVKDLIKYLKPPYLQVIYNTTNDVNNNLFITGSNTTGNPLGQILI